MAAQGPVVSWVAVHRRHHERSDKPGDPHSPNPALVGGGAFATLRGLWHAHVGWLTNHEYPNPVHYVPELLRDRTIARISRHYLLWVALGLALPATLGGLAHGSWLGAFQGFLWGWVALPTFGESWQNNHHAFASSAAIGLRWWQVDLGYGLIVVLERLGLVWGVRRPTPAMIASKRVTA
jgi:stearoyl-CoA desaturase (delta-9 desaturase)